MVLLIERRIVRRMDDIIGRLPVGLLFEFLDFFIIIGNLRTMLRDFKQSENYW